MGIRLALIVWTSLGVWGSLLACGQQQKPITAISVLPSQDNSVLLASDDGLFKSDLSKKSRQNLKSKIEKITAIQLSPDQKYIAVLGGTPGEVGSIEIWTSDCKRIFQKDLFSDVATCAVWLDGQTIWVAGLTGKMTQLHVPRQELKTIKSGHSRGILAIAKLREQTLLTGSIDHSVRVHRKSPRTLNNHSGAVNALKVQPSQKSSGLELVASCSADGTVRFWQPKIGRMVRFVRLKSVPTCIVWINQGTQLVAGCRDGHLRWIDPSTARVTKLKRISDDWIFCLCVDSGQDRLLVGTAAGLKTISLK